MKENTWNEIEAKEQRERKERTKEREKKERRREDFVIKDWKNEVNNNRRKSIQL